MSQLTKTGTDPGVPARGEDEILWGAAEIGRAIRRSPRQTFHLLENGRLPATKMGAIWTSTRRRLLGAFSGQACDD